MKNRIITISREFGSGGRTIGKAVAEELGIPCYDNEILQKLAEESGFAESYLREAGEDAPGGFLASAFSRPASGTAMRIISGRSNTSSSPGWRKKAPA